MSPIGDVSPTAVSCHMESAVSTDQVFCNHQGFAFVCVSDGQLTGSVKCPGCIAFGDRRRG